MGRGGGVPLRGDVPPQSQVWRKEEEEEEHIVVIGGFLLLRGVYVHDYYYFSLPREGASNSPMTTWAWVKGARRDVSDKGNLRRTAGNKAGNPRYTEEAPGGAEQGVEHPGGGPRPGAVDGVMDAGPNAA